MKDLNSNFDSGESDRFTFTSFISINTRVKGILFLLVFVCLAMMKADAQNYDESKVSKYTLPGILTSKNGQNIRDTAAWETTRRPEILKMFEEHVYGSLPRQSDSMGHSVKKSTKKILNAKAYLKEVTLTIWRNNKLVEIYLTLLIPVNKTGAVPAFLLINNRDKSLTNPHRDTTSNFWPAEMMIDSGYAMAAFHVSDAAPDQPADYHKGVLELYPDQLDSSNGMKAIGAWAWAAIKIMDYLETDADIDSKKVALVGHSRGGKAALWAAAQDTRFAMVIANCSGNTGAAISRRKFGETVSVINNRFPHWFADNYRKYNDNEAALPIDQHMLIALIAPRPLYTTNATEDRWADPRGSYLSIAAGAEVYTLYNKKVALTPTMPEADQAIIRSALGYHIRTGIHDMTQFDWQQFARFARYHFGDAK